MSAPPIHPTWIQWFFFYFLFLRSQGTGVVRLGPWGLSGSILRLSHRQKSLVPPGGSACSRIGPQTSHPTLLLPVCPSICLQVSSPLSVGPAFFHSHLPKLGFLYIRNSCQRWLPTDLDLGSADSFSNGRRQHDTLLLLSPKLSCEKRHMIFVPIKLYWQKTDGRPALAPR